MVHRGCVHMAGIIGLVLLVLLAGCANNMENAAQLLADRDPSTCRFTSDGETQVFEGKICEDIARERLKNQAYSACAGMAAENEGMCVVAVALSSANQGNSGSRTSDEIQLMIAAMNNDTQITSAWISQIPLVGTVAASYFNYKSNQDLYQTFEAGLSAPGTMNITQSNDGGGVGGEAGGGGRGGDGDLMVFTGDSAQSLNRSDGSVVSDGRNGTFMGLNEPDSSFDPTTQNLNNAPNATNDNAPAVQTSDDDGGQSLIPSL